MPATSRRRQQGNRVANFLHSSVATGPPRINGGHPTPDRAARFFRLQRELASAAPHWLSRLAADTFASVSDHCFSTDTASQTAAPLIAGVVNWTEIESPAATLTLSAGDSIS